MLKVNEILAFFNTLVIMIINNNEECFMQSFLEKLRTFMYGRNGFDRLGFFTAFAYLLFNGIKMCFMRNAYVYYTLWVIALVFLAVTVFRFLSKDITKRLNEAEKFEQFLAKIRFDDRMFGLRKKFKRLGIRLSQIKTHRFRTCPQCHEHLRLSKKRGTRNITCPKCGRKFKAFVLF